jgi:acyl-homoserine lactone acylase PvdQ
MLAVAGGGVQHLPMPIMTRCLAVPFLLLLIAAAPVEEQQWKAQAKRVTIVRDDWGIAHVQGARDADAVFGMMYVQAEDDFSRIEANYLTALGRSAEAEGEKAIWRDLRARLYVSEGELKAQYAASPAWLRGLMNAWAAGLNYYLAKHPEVRPRVLRRFEPWMALSFTEGSIGGDIERIDLAKLEQFYSGPGAAAQQAAIRRAARVERYRDRAQADQCRACAAADQPAHQLLLPVRATGHERPGTERLWGVHLGSVLHLSGVQSAARVDAHVQRCR